MQRGAGLSAGLTKLATWSLRFILIAAAAALLWLVLGRLWVIVLPVFLAVFLATLLWPPTAWLRRHRFPPAAAAITVVIGGLVLLGGLFAALAPSVAGQVAEIASAAGGGLSRVQDWLTGPPLNLSEDQVASIRESATQRLQDSASSIAAGLITSVSALTSVVVAAALILILVFYFIKDGPRFLPWADRVVGPQAARHVDPVLRRSWAVLGGFIRSQAAVGLIDAVLIGLGLVILGVPLALPLAVLTFFGGFVPIVGAFVVGALSVLVALVSNGVTTALIVLVIIVVVQQVEGNVLQPVLQSRSLRLHATVILLAVAAGSSLYGIAGAFLAVPVVAIVAEVLRYIGEQVDRPADPDQALP